MALDIPGMKEVGSTTGSLLLDSASFELSTNLEGCEEEWAGFHCFLDKDSASAYVGRKAERRWRQDNAKARKSFPNESRCVVLLSLNERA